jgi:hypothetical protein
VVRVNPAICFAVIRSFPSAVRRAALVKRQAFFAPANPQTAEIAIFEQTIANYGERDLQTGSPVLYRKEKL